jgi:hypothetical protein
MEGGDEMIVVSGQPRQKMLVRPCLKNKLGLVSYSVISGMQEVKVRGSQSETGL